MNGMTTDYSTLDKEKETRENGNKVGIDALMLMRHRNSC
jgi:hypothetical protein